MVHWFFFLLYEYWLGLDHKPFFKVGVLLWIFRNMSLYSPSGTSQSAREDQRVEKALGGARMVRGHGTAIHPPPPSSLRNRPLSERLPPQLQRWHLWSRPQVLTSWSFPRPQRVVTVSWWGTCFPAELEPGAVEAGAALVRMPPMPEPVCLPRVLVWAELSINRQKIQCVCVRWLQEAVTRRST